MAIEELNEQQFGDLFGETVLKPMQSSGFSAEENLGTDILSTPPKTEDAPQKTQEELDAEAAANKDTDILNQEGDAQSRPGRKPKYDFTDASGYFADRFKSGKFVPIEQEAADGQVTQFIPKTPEEFDEVIDLQVNYQLEQKIKDMEQMWYESKSPAWQAVARFAEMTDDPSEIMPFLQGVRSVESVSELDPADLDAAERIVRTRLEQRGEQEDVIAEQIDALKTTDKLVSTAQKYKPLILQEEKQHLSQMMNQKRAEEQEYVQMVTGIRDEAIKAIEAPIYGRKLKQDEKALIYDMIAEPSPETSGYKIYTAIDNLFATGDFDRLREIALILGKKESLINYISSSAANNAAQDLQRKLRVSTENRSSTGNTDLEDQQHQAAINRARYNGGPTRFGR